MIIGNTSTFSNYLPRKIDLNVPEDDNQRAVFTDLLSSYLVLCNTVHVDAFNNKQIFTFGFRDGRVCIRTYDQRMGTITHGAEFQAHRTTVVNVGTDMINGCPASADGAGTDILLGAAGGSSPMASLTCMNSSVDADGVLMVWCMNRKYPQALPIRQR